MIRAGTLLRRPLFGVLAAIALVAAGAAAGWTAATAQTHQHQQAAAPEKAGWLAKLGPEARTEAIQRQLRGFETTMAEVAYRYGEMYWGGVDGNWGYAEHMHEELGKALDLGLERRPEYRKSAETFVLKTTLPQVCEAIKKKDQALFKQRIEELRAACTSCHAAEKHAFIKIGLPTVRRNPVEKP
jgi:hypothetical protein